MSKDRLKHRKQFFDYEKELAYINEMNRLGWKLERVKHGRVYEFVKTEPEEYTTLIYAEKRSKLKKTEALAHRCGYETIPHKADGLKRLLYLTGRRDEVSPVFYNDSDSALRAQRIIHRRFFVMSVFCVILSLALIAALAVLFVIPALTSGKSPSEYPMFFGLTIAFSVLTLVFLVFTCIYIGSAAGVKKKIKKIIKKEEEKSKRKKRAAQRRIEPELIEQSKSVEPEQRAVDMTKKDTDNEQPNDDKEKSDDAPENEQGAEQEEKAEEKTEEKTEED